MRVALLLILSLAFSGCASEEPSDEMPDVPVEQGNVTVPEPLQWSGSLQAVAEPAMGTTTGCQVEQGCASHSFDVKERLNVEIVLKSTDGTVTGVTAGALWGSDYDLTLRDAAGTELGTSTNPGTEDDVLVLSLDPGSYTIEVMAWNDQDGSYDLTVTFAA